MTDCCARLRRPTSTVERTATADRSRTACVCPTRSSTRSSGRPETRRRSACACASMSSHRSATTSNTVCGWPGRSRPADCRLFQLRRWLVFQLLDGDPAGGGRGVRLRSSVRALKRAASCRSLRSAGSRRRSRPKTVARGRRGHDRLGAPTHRRSGNAEQVEGGPRRPGPLLHLLQRCLPAPGAQEKAIRCIHNPGAGREREVNERTVPASRSPTRGCRRRRPGRTESCGDRRPSRPQVTLLERAESTAVRSISPRGSPSTRPSAK